MNKAPRKSGNIARRNKTIGRDFQKEVCQMILNKFQELTSDDVRSNPMGAQGEDILLSSSARKLLKNTQHECKSREKLAMVEWMEQAAGHGKHSPIVWFKKSGKRNTTFVAMPVEHYFTLLGK